MTHPSEEHERAWHAWRETRRASLCSPEGWLSLVDKIPLEPGPNRLAIGTAILEATGRVQFRPRADVHVTLKGVPVIEQRGWNSDESGVPDVLLEGERRWELVQRADTFAVRVRDPGTPARSGFGPLPCFPYDPTWRVVAQLEPYEPPRAVTYEYEVGPGAHRLCPGVLCFEVGGQQLRLEPTIEARTGRLFLPFADGTNRDLTYPAGRLMYAPLPQDGQVVLDFNRAFNPPCAFTAFAACPLPPPANRLPVRVEAGEQRYGG